jgi:hypothetical protein
MSNGNNRKEVWCLPSPMTHLATLEACSWVTLVFLRSTTTRYFYPDLVAHKVTFIVLGNTLFGSLAVLKFL